MADRGAQGPGCLGLFLLVGVVGLLIGVFDGGDEERGDGGRSGPSASEILIGAEIVCEDAVRDQLKAPDTADFSDTEAEKAGGSKYVVRGAVDSENSFGAKLRAQWICDAEHIRGDRYRASATLVE